MAGTGRVSPVTHLRRALCVLDETGKKRVEQGARSLPPAAAAAAPTTAKRSRKKTPTAGSARNGENTR